MKGAAFELCCDMMRRSIWPLARERLAGVVRSLSVNVQWYLVAVIGLYGDHKMVF